MNEVSGQGGNVDPRLQGVGGIESSLVFERNLKKSQLAPIWKKDSKSPVARDLQRTLDTIPDGGRFDELDAKINQYIKQNHFVTLTEGKFYEVTPAGYKPTTPKIQVKEGTITWYFSGVGHDESTQEFRDQIFRTAALGHLLVDGACSKYYRGTNAMHVKRMHTSENESASNHNHYRVEDNFVTASQFAEHLQGFLKAQEAYKIPEKFLDKEEAEELISEYQEYEKHMNEPLPVDEGGDGLMTRREHFHRKEKAKWFPEDFQELQNNKHIEAPCEAQQVIIPLNERVIDIGENRKMLPKFWVNHPELSSDVLDIISRVGSEGQMSNVAHTRQLPNSRFKTRRKAYTRLGELFEKNANRNYPGIVPPIEVAQQYQAQEIQGEREGVARRAQPPGEDELKHPMV